MRRFLIILAVTSIAVAALAGPAGATEPRCCVKTGSPPPLPFTGISLYIPVLLSLGAIGVGIVLRRRTREEL